MNRPSTNKKAKRGSGGLILCYYRKEIMDGIEFINNLEHIDHLWVKLDKNFFGFPKDVYVCSVYVTPESSTLNTSRNNFKHVIDF